MDTLASLFAPTRESAATALFPFRLFRLRSLVIVNRSLNPIQYLEVLPRPRISTVNPRLVAAYAEIQSVQVELTDLQVQGIPKKQEGVLGGFTEDELIGRGISFLIDAVMVGGVPQGGIEADKVPGLQLEERDLTWEIILRRRSLR